MPRLTQQQRQEALVLRHNSYSVSQLMSKYGVGRSTIQRLFQRVGETGTPSDRERSGRPRASSEREDRLLPLTWMTGKREKHAHTHTRLASLLTQGLCSYSHAS